LSPNFRVGLTGGIGAGKSEVSRRLAAQGAVVIDADALAREVVAPGTPGLAEVQNWNINNKRKEKESIKKYN